VPLLKLAHVSRYGELARLLLAHRGALGKDMPDDQADAKALAEDADRLVLALQDMGPTYVKLGQLLSSRVDLLPASYTDALRRLQDHAEPLPFEIVRQIAEEELGAPLTVVFSTVETDPLGAASMAQVHRAVLRDGRTVAIKVQRPGIRPQILEDMDVISELAATFDEHVGAARRAGLCAMVDEFRRVVLDELDYQHEAANLKVLAEVLEPYDRLFPPAPIEECSTARLLVMTLIEGTAVGRLADSAVPEAEGEVLVSQLFKAYLDQILVHGVYHADPHPGNVLLTPDRRLALLDVGMTGRLSPELRETLLRMLVALGEGRGTAVAGALERAGEKLVDYDRNGLQRDVSALVETIARADVGHMQVGRQLAELARLSVANGLRPLPELSMVGKTLLNLDDVARHLAPTYEPATAIREHAASVTRDHLLSTLSPSRLVSTALDAKELAERFPDRMNRLLEALADGNIHMRVEGMDEREIMRSVQKLANRAAAGLVVGAFVLAAAIFSIAARGPHWWGISAFTVVFLGIAAVLGGAIVLSTLRNDTSRSAARCAPDLASGNAAGRRACTDAGSDHTGMRSRRASTVAGIEPRAKAGPCDGATRSDVTVPLDQKSRTLPYRALHPVGRPSTSSATVTAVSCTIAMSSSGWARRSAARTAPRAARARTICVRSGVSVPEKICTSRRNMGQTARSASDLRTEGSSDSTLNSSECAVTKVT